MKLTSALPVEKKKERADGKAVTKNGDPDSTLGGPPRTRKMCKID